MHRMALGLAAAGIAFVAPAVRADDVRNAKTEITGPSGLVAAVRSQIFACWKPVNGSIMTVRMTLNQDGSLSGEPIVVNYGGSPSQAAAASALRAIRLCQPFRLPVAKYHLWQTIEITFVPHPPPWHSRRTIQRLGRPPSPIAAYGPGL
jgi:hypothetical protein